MTKTVLQFIVKLIVLVLAQAVIFNNIVLFNAAVPFVFLYILISMPITWSTNATLTIGFIVGLAIDIFSNTLGVNAMACTLIAFAQKPFFHLYMQHDEKLSGIKPSQQSMGTAAFVKYMSTMVIAYCLVVFIIDAFAVFNLVRFLLQVAGSSFYTIILIFAIDSLFTRQHEKRQSA